MLTANPGYYRIPVFITTDALFSESNRTITEAEGQRWFTGGLNALPPSIASQPYEAGVICTALIYEFERPSESDAMLLVPSPLDARTHLMQAGLRSAFAAR